jgi:glycosyltransferase involved in cell wall biosynthesis
MVKSSRWEWEQYKEYTQFVKWQLSRGYKIPPRPSSTGTVMDNISRGNLTQKRWDELYGRWRKFIEGFKPEGSPEVSIEEYRRRKPLPSMKNINPILIIWSPRRIAEVAQAFNKIDYVDKVWFKYFSKPQVLEQTRKFMAIHKEYTHMILVLDDVICPPDSVKNLLKTLIVYDLPVLSGCFNFCNCWMRGNKGCSWCMEGKPHPYINITLDPLPFKALRDKNPIRADYKFLTEEWRQANPVIKQVWFEGFGLAIIRRDIYEKIGLRCWVPSKNFTSDVPWADDLDKARIPQFCDFRIKLHHRAFEADRDLLVGVRRSRIIFQPAKRQLEILPLSKLVVSSRRSYRKRQKREKPKLTKKRLNVLIVIDQYGWAFDFGARGIQAYSKHNVTIKRLDKVTPRDVKFNDVIFCMCSGQWISIAGYPANLRAFNKRKPKMRVCVGLRASPREAELIYNREGEHVPARIPADAIGCISKETYHFTLEKERELGTFRPVYLTHSAVNTKLFKPRKKPRHDDDFTVGWVGNSTRPIKRTRLLSHIIYPVKVRDVWGPKHFKKGRSQQPMVDFYHSIDVLINLSLSEGLPQPILEAMASGLPIVSSAVGAIPEVIDNRWVVPPMPEDEFVEGINRRLRILKRNYSLRQRIGKRNRQKCLNSWSWKHIVKRYDDMFEGVEG